MFIERAMFEFFGNIIIRIETETGSGTGFVYRNRDGLALIATAAHVINQADIDGTPITLSNDRNLAPISLLKSERVISKNFSPSTGDAAIISIKPQILGKFPKDELPILGWQQIIATGERIGWVGFPTTHFDTLCFFSGHISARLNGTRAAYLVDGSAICGVSGGPAFRLDHQHSGGGVYIIGIISQFYPFQTPRTPTDKRQDSYPGLMQVESFDQVKGLVAEIDRLNGHPPEWTIFG